MLLAWELMFPSWQTNHYLAKRNEPSLDFVFVDETGTLYAFELQRTITSPGESCRVLAQVMHRAVRIHQTRAFDKLHEAFVQSRTDEARNDAPPPLATSTCSSITGRSSG